MTNWEIVLLTGLVTVVTSVITSLITLSFTRKNEIRKKVLKERTAMYLDFYSVTDGFINHPRLVFDEACMKEFLSYKPKMKLLSSNITYPIYTELFQTMIEPYNFYDVYIGKQNNENLSCFDTETVEKMNEEDFKLTSEEFINRYCPDSKKIDSLIEKLYQSMRKDLGSDIKRRCENALFQYCS